MSKSRIMIETVWFDGIEPVYQATVIPVNINIWISRLFLGD